MRTPSGEKRKESARVRPLEGERHIRRECRVGPEEITWVSEQTVVGSDETGCVTVVKQRECESKASENLGRREGRQRSALARKGIGEEVIGRLGAGTGLGRLKMARNVVSK